MAPTPDPDRLLTVAAAAAWLGLDNPRTLRDHWRRWEIPAYRVGRVLRFRESDLEAWLRKQAAGSARGARGWPRPAAQVAEDKLAEAVRVTVESAPLLTAAQRDELRALLDTAAVP